MSTSSKIFENRLQVDRKSPRRSINLSTSPHLTPRSRNQSQSDDSQQYDQDQLLKMQIRQIKRQNKFLKKKIKELVSEMNGDKPSKKKTSKMGPPKQDKDSTHLTVDFFFDQLNSLINTLVDLFKVDFSPQQITKFSQKFPDTEYESPIKKFTAIKKFTLNRKLSKIMLEQQQKRYPLLLQVFMNYYNAKQQSDQHIRKVVDKLTTKALELNKLIVSKAQKKASSRGPKSHHHFQYQDTASYRNRVHRDDFNIPWKFGVITAPNSQLKSQQTQYNLKSHKKITSPRRNL